MRNNVVENNKQLCPGLDEQTYTIEEAGFKITFPRGLSLIEETSQRKDSYRLFAFSKGYSVTVLISTGWKPAEWNEDDFRNYVSEEFNQIFTNGIFNNTSIIRYDDFDAIRIVGRTSGNNLNAFRAYYDILHGSTYVRIAIYSENLAGKPSESFIKSGDDIVGTIRFSEE